MHTNVPDVSSFVFLKLLISDILTFRLELKGSVHFIEFKRGRSVSLT